MEDFEKEALLKIARNKKTRLFKLQEIAALKGFNTDPEISIEIDQIEKDINQLDNRIKNASKEIGNPKSITSDIINIFREMSLIDAKFVSLFERVLEQLSAIANISRDSNNDTYEMIQKSFKVTVKIVNELDSQDKTLGSAILFLFAEFTKLDKRINDIEKNVNPQDNTNTTQL